MTMDHDHGRFNLILFFLFLSSTSLVASQSFPAPVPGLAYGFYNKSCPAAESTVAKIIQSFLRTNMSEAAGLLRLFFHDCFVQGCDGSVLINDTNGEQPTPPNFTLRPSALAIVDVIKRSLEIACPNTVSCADTLALATREAIAQAGGPFFPIPTGRRDSLNFAASTDDLPGPGSDASQLINAFSVKSLNLSDLVALSGAHTIGLAHCGSFRRRIQPSFDPSLDVSFARSLLHICPNASVNVPTHMDVVTPDKFDNQYYRNVINGEVVFNSDTTLLNDKRTRGFVKTFSSNQTEFFRQFSNSFIKMSMIEVLTGKAGNIRKVCSVFNPQASSLIHAGVATADSIAQM